MTRVRNAIITIFVIVWCAVFHYESVRHFYLEPFIGKPLPKVKFLFPPAGWIMFYNVDNAYGYTRVFGIKDGEGVEIDPHDIFRVRTIGFDNIHRGVIGAVTYMHNRQQFCRHMFKQFTHFDSFRIVSTHYPNFVDEPYKQYHQLLYTCTE